MAMGGQSNPNHSHSFDAGAAWAHLALQATALGYHTHGMTGVDFAKARDVLGVPAGFRIEAAVWRWGRQAPAERLPEGLREREGAQRSQAAGRSCVRRRVPRLSRTGSIGAWRLS